MHLQKFHIVLLKMQKISYLSQISHLYATADPELTIEPWEEWLECMN